MRLVRLIGFLMLVSAFQLTMAQSQPESPTEQSNELNKIVSLFPNPATEYLHVKLDEFPAEKVTLSMHNILGNEVEIETEIVSEHELRVQVKDFASGYYLLAVKNEEAKFRGIYKFLKR